MTDVRRVYVKPAEIYWSDQPSVYKTVLGSCVAVCLWDARHSIGGINHFILPRMRPGEEDARFGDIAIPRLVAGMRALGCADLIAKVFGGAAVLQGSGRSIGEANTEVALELLAHARIPVMAQRTGGALGVVISFFSLSADVLLREILADPGAIMPEARPVKIWS